MAFEVELGHLKGFGVDSRKVASEKPSVAEGKSEFILPMVVVGDRSTLEVRLHKIGPGSGLVDVIGISLAEIDVKLTQVARIGDNISLIGAIIAGPNLF